MGTKVFVNIAVGNCQKAGWPIILAHSLMMKLTMRLTRETALLAHCCILILCNLLLMVRARTPHIYGLTEPFDFHHVYATWHHGAFLITPHRLTYASTLASPGGTQYNDPLGFE